MKEAKQRTDEVQTFVIVAVKKHLQARTILLFGSRARGDHRPRSDYDIAIDAPTLCSFDFLWLQQEIADIASHVDNHEIRITAVEGSVKEHFSDKAKHGG